MLSHQSEQQLYYVFSQAYLLLNISLNILSLFFREIVIKFESSKITENMSIKFLSKYQKNIILKISLQGRVKKHSQGKELIIQSD